MSQPDTSAHSEGGFRESAASSSDAGLLRERFRFLLSNRKWWLLPIILVVLMLAATVYLTAAAPFVYTLV